jgi:hypothetical protein
MERLWHTYASCQILIRWSHTQARKLLPPWAASFVQPDHNVSCALGDIFSSKTQGPTHAITNPRTLTPKDTCNAHVEVSYWLREIHAFVFSWFLDRVGNVLWLLQEADWSLSFGWLDSSHIVYAEHHGVRPLKVSPLTQHINRCSKIGHLAPTNKQPMHTLQMHLRTIIVSENLFFLFVVILAALVHSGVPPIRTWDLHCAFLFGSDEAWSCLTLRSLR